MLHRFFKKHCFRFSPLKQPLALTSPLDIELFWLCVALMQPAGVLRSRAKNNLMER
jgi:hypothetical protein